MNAIRQYKDVSGNPCTLDWLVRNEPIWAANQIRHRDVLMAEREWQPIETAPRDGKSVLLACSHQGGTFIETGYWDPNFRMSWSEELEALSGTGAWTNGYQDGSEYPVEFTPTHWMELPKPPQ